MSFLGEIKRRKVFQVAAVYAVVAWLLVQVITSVEEPLNLPEWADSLVIMLLAIGFPITLKSPLRRHLSRPYQKIGYDP